MLTLIHHVLYDKLPQDVVRLIITDCIIPKFSMSQHLGYVLNVELLGITIKETFQYKKYDLISCSKQIKDYIDPNHFITYKFGQMTIQITNNTIYIVAYRMNYRFTCGHEGRESLSRAFIQLYKIISKPGEKIGKILNFNHDIPKILPLNCGLSLMKDRLVFFINYYTLRITCRLLRCNEPISEIKKMYFAQDFNLDILNNDIHNIEISIGKFHIIIDEEDFAPICAHEAYINSEGDVTNTLVITRPDVNERYNPSLLISMYNQIVSMVGFILKEPR